MHTPKPRAKAAGLGSLPGEMEEHCDLLFRGHRPPSLCTSFPLPHVAVPMLSVVEVSPLCLPHPLGRELTSWLLHLHQP